MQRRDFFLTGYSLNETSFTQKKTASHSNRDKYMEKMELWICKICKKDYASKASLNRHISTAHEQPKPRAIAQASPKAVQKVQQSFTCRHCGGEYSSQGNLNRHISAIHQKPVAGNVAVSNTTTQVQKKKTNITINVYNPVTVISKRSGY